MKFGSDLKCNVFTTSENFSLGILKLRTLVSANQPKIQSQSIAHYTSVSQIWYICYNRERSFFKICRKIKVKFVRVRIY